MEPGAVCRLEPGSRRRESPCESHPNSPAMRVEVGPEVADFCGREQVKGEDSAAFQRPYPVLRDRLVAPARRVQRSTGAA